jgi:Holliday junction resolvasome RuvABC endonuclease subunit
VLGIDPGKDGAAALMEATRGICTLVDSVAWRGKGTGVQGQEAGADAVASLLSRYQPNLVAMETPVVGPNMRGALVQGMGYGMIYQVLRRGEHELIEVNPRSVHSLAGGTDSRPYCRMRGWPTKNKHLADACVIADWASRRAS